jgi:hypothetical protein
MVECFRRRGSGNRCKALLGPGEIVCARDPAQDTVDRSQPIGFRFGTELSFARAKDLAPLIEAIRAEGIISATGIAKALNERGIPTSRGGKWQAVQVQRLERARR